MFYSSIADERCVWCEPDIAHPCLTRSERKRMPDHSTFDLISPVSMHRPNGYSHLAKVKNGTPVFIAGQVALDPSGHLVGAGDLRTQAQQVFENLRSAVEAAGGSFYNIVKLNVYVVDRSHLPQYREVRKLAGPGCGGR